MLNCTSPPLPVVLQKALQGERLTLEEGLCLPQADLLTLGRIADERRKHLHPGRVVSFVIDRVIQQTNICIVECHFCPFWRTPSDPQAYVLSNEEILSNVEALVQMGGTQVLIQGGVNPALSLSYYEDLFREIKRRYPVDLHSLSVPEIDFLCKRENLSPVEVLKRLRDAGLSSLPGAGAEILEDRIREIISPGKASSDRWLEIMEAAHEAGLFTTATMMYGSVETWGERLAHLVRIRNLQDKTGQFTAFIPWNFVSRNTPLSCTNGRFLAEVSGVDYLTTIAISRIMLDNIPNIQSGWLTPGRKLAQVALFFGANDAGGILLEDKVMESADVRVDLRVQDLIALIRGAGRIPAQRNTRYEILKVF